MKSTIQRHIKELEELQAEIEARLNAERDTARRNRLEADLRAAGTAIGHYKLALRIEGLPRLHRPN